MISIKNSDKRLACRCFFCIIGNSSYNAKKLYVPPNGK